MKIKSLIARTIKNIGKLCAFTLLVIPSFAICCLLGSWTIDPNGNLIGNNLINQENVTITQRGFVIQGMTPNNFDAGTYTLSFNFNGYFGSGTLVIRDIEHTNNTEINFNLQEKTIITFTMQTNWEFFYMWSDLGTYSNWMLNKGTTALEYDPYGVYYSSQNYYDLQETYEQALQGTSIDYNNYTIQLVNYPTSDTTSNYNVVQTLTTRDYVNEQGFLNVYEIIQITGFGNTWDGIVITSNQYLNTYNYNLLFNGSGNSNLDFAIYYKYYESEKFRKLSLMNIVGDSTYYGYFDLINLFGKNAIEENIQDILYNKFAIHWTNNPSPNDLINIKLNSTDGYNMGYAKGVQDNLINLEELNETIEEQTKQLQEKQKQYDALLEHYNNAQLNNPLSSMVVAVADIPLNLFHNMFNFDIMGFNLAAFILGIITILLVAYVIKLFL